MERTGQEESFRNKQEEVRRMVMDSYQDMLGGKGRDYKDFFAEWKANTKIPRHDFLRLACC